MLFNQKNTSFKFLKKEYESMVKQMVTGGYPLYLRGLVRLAQNAGDNFKAGYIFYGGDEILPMSRDGYEFWAIPFGVLFGEA